MPTNPGIHPHPLHRVTLRGDVMASWAVVLPRDLDNSFGCDAIIDGVFLPIEKKMLLDNPIFTILAAVICQNLFKIKANK